VQKNWGGRVKQKEYGIQTVIIALCRFPTDSDVEFDRRIQEMKGLCEAAGAVVADVITQQRAKPDPALYLGSGKVKHLAEQIIAFNANCVIFDAELSPAQVRNLESELDCRVVDRTQLILDIFAKRAMSKAGRLQVEIAQLQYLLPRLTGRGIQMSRLGGGIGTRGPGETKLETDRRRIHKRISHLKTALQHVERIRETQRAKRTRSVPIVALVGYTNAGKTTVLNRWVHKSGASVAPIGNERLFDTLDPFARKVKAGTNDSLVVLDTVGFIHNLPHLLVDAFRSTLEEVRACDLIVQVVDGSDNVDVHLGTTYQVLKEIGADTKPCITFFNKMDLVKIEPAPDTKAILSVFGSARSGEGMDMLIRAVEETLRLDPIEIEISIPPEAKRVWGSVSHFGKIVETVAEENGSVRVLLQMDRKYIEDFNQTFDRLLLDEL
jgi:GTPase